MSVVQQLFQESTFLTIGSAVVTTSSLQHRAFVREGLKYTAVYLDLWPLCIIYV
jgi:hypothetical protein